MNYVELIYYHQHILSDSVIGKQNKVTHHPFSSITTMLPLSASNFLDLGHCIAGFGEWWIAVLTFPLQCPSDFDQAFHSFCVLCIILIWSGLVENVCKGQEMIW
jgi:hypothetical protein